LCASAQPISLNGPWRFHTGDNPSWAMPEYNDSKWELVDLTPTAGAHDGDVGLTNYVSGWQAREHKGYTGFAWYRLRVPVPQHSQEPWVLAGPAAADDIYQIFADGKLLGGIGDFSGANPSIYAIQPKFFTLPVTATDSMTVAIRVWAGPQIIAGDPTSGGVRIAPITGTKTAVYPLYHKQWMQTFWGYVVDAVEPLLFLILAVLALRWYRYHPFYSWLAVSLILAGLVRASQVFYFWGQWESLDFYYWSKEIFWLPLSTCAWLITWIYWYELKPRWLKPTVALLCFAYIATRAISDVWQYHTINPNAATYSHIIHWVRIALLILMIAIVIMGVMRQKRQLLLVLAIVLLLGIGLFAGELSSIGIKGIWFPFGVGVSRTQYVCALMVPLLFVLLCRKPVKKFQ